MSLLDTFTTAISGMFSAEDGERCEQSLAEFVRQAWAIIDPGNPLVWGPSMDAICEHLEAVQDGFITRLLMTVPPGFSKSRSACAFRPVVGAAARILQLSTSYSQGLTRHNNNRCRHILWRYQTTWGKKYSLQPQTSRTQQPSRPAKLDSDLGGRPVPWHTR
jgi:hypothetical protein